MAAPQSNARIVEKVDENQLVTLKGNTPPPAIAKNDLGRVSPTLPMTDLILVLSRSPEQQAAFDAFVASQYEVNSPNYHHWLEPAEIGEKFGPALADIATISSWLTGHGFSVAEVAKDRMTIRFSGNAGQVESAFHTEIHNLTVKGEPHISNMSDPQIPAALSPVVLGVKALHDFRPRPLHKLGSKVTLNSQTGKWERVASANASASNPAAATAKAHPEFGINVGSGSNAYLVEDVVPYDFAAIYNVLPLWNASTPIDGTGQTIAVAGTSDIRPGDVATFRQTFGLPSTTPAPKTIVGNGTDPGICEGTSTTTPCNIDDQTENALDVEWSGAIAKNAQIILIASGMASATDDNVYDSVNYAIQNNIAKILNVSYGLCELFEGTAGNASYNNLYQTGAAAGIAIFVAAGDSGSPACDEGGDDGGTNVPYAAQFGLSVSGLASPQYVTAVGGTDLNWGSTAAPYWNSTNNATNGSNALGYMPEAPWNDSCTNPLVLSYLQSWAKTLQQNGFPQAASPTDAESACNFVLTWYQTIYQGTQGGTDLSFLVDTVGGSGGASNCTTNSTTSTTTTPDPTSCSGGYPTPSWQTGVTGIPATGKRYLPDVSFFASNGFLGSAYLICISDAGACVTSTTITTEPTAQEIGGTSAASPAMAGVMALINQKAGTSQGSPNSELYSLATKQTYSSCTTENGTTSNGCYFNDVDTGTNAMACAPSTPNCTVSTSGDAVGVLSGYSATAGFDLATGLGTLNVANVVNGFTSQIGTATATVTVAPTPSSIAANQSLSVQVTVTGASGMPTPTGNVALSGGGYSTSGSLSGGSYTFTIPASTLSAGTVTLTAAYGGDSNYASASGTASVTVTAPTLLTPTVTVTPASGSISSGASLNVAVKVTGSGATPTGTVTLTSGSYTSSATTLSSGSATITIPANTLSAGTATLTVNYSGDTNYNSGSGSATVTVTAAPLTPTVTVTPASSSIDAGQSLNVTANVTGAGATPTGMVTLTGGGYTSSAETLASGSYTFAIPANSLSAGTDKLTVNYSGDSVYATGSGTTSVTVTASAYSLAASAPAAVTAGGSTTSTITLTSSTYYTGTVTLSCSLTSSPSGAVNLPTCSASSGTITVASGTPGGTGSVTVTTTGSTAALAKPKIGGWDGAGGGAVLALLVFLGIPARRRSWRAMLGVLVLMMTLGSLAACGGSSSSSSSSTTSGNYTFTVTGTGNDSAKTTATTTFTLTVN